MTTELGLNAAHLGLLADVYFLVFAAVQLPMGALLDRVGPSIVQIYERSVPPPTQRQTQ